MTHYNHLNDISQVVMAADNPTVALDDLTQTLPPKHQQTLAVLREILSGKIPDDKTLKKTKSLWALLFRLARLGDKSPTAYLGQYQSLSKASLPLGNAAQAQNITLAYLSYLILFLFIVLFTTVKKTLPTFAVIYEGYGVALPGITQFILQDGFLWLTALGVFIVVFIGFIVPLSYRRRIKQLMPIPWYLRWFLFYFFLTRYYHQYLHTVFAGIYYQVNETNPIQRGGKMLPGTPTKTLQIQLLQVALRQGSFTTAQQRQQQQLAETTLKQMRLANGQLSIVVLLIFALFLVLFIMGIYLPIFNMGELIK